jgi:glycine cleavage system aminomethyltransferase T
VSLSAWAEAPAPLRADGREVGTLTSSAQSPDGELFGIGVVKVTAAIPGAEVVAGDGIPAKLTARIGAQPPYISEEAN